MTRIAIMQPYVFPYIGYFQLIAATDRFVILDDVAYIKRGWINRNRILVNGAPHFFSVPLHKASQNRKICDTQISSVAWKEDLLKTLRLTYSRSPHFASTFAFIADIVSAEYKTIADLAYQSIEAVCRYVGVTTDFVRSTSIYQNGDLKGAERIVDICRQEGAAVYLNLPGGVDLYSPDKFSQYGIDLRFLTLPQVKYEQFREPFVSNLSIIDILMFNSAEKTRELIEQSRFRDPKEEYGELK